MQKSSSKSSRLIAFSLSCLAFVFLSLSAFAATSLDSDFPIQYQNPNYKTSEQSTGSGVTFWPNRNSYLLLDNTIGSYQGQTGSRLLEYGTNNVQIREIVLVGFQDPEDIHWISTDTFVIAQEYNTGPNPDSENELVVIDIPTSGNVLNISSSIRRLKLPSLGGNRSNLGIEAVALIGNTFYFTTEKAPNASDSSTWKVWTVPNSGSGNVTPTLTVAFALSSLLAGKASDISGLATDGTDLWFLSHEGSGSTLGRVLRVTTSGTLIADYQLPTFTGNVSWPQAEGIELFIDPYDNALKILLAGEDPATSGTAPGTDLMRLTKQAVTIAANDPSAAEPEGSSTYTGQFTITRNVSPNTPLTVNFTTAGSTATSGSDYTAIGTSVTISANANSATINVTPIDDTAYEPDETVEVTLSANANYVVSSGPATVTIQSIFELAGASYVSGVNSSGQAVTDLGRHNGDGSLAQAYSFVPYGINDSGNVVGDGFARIGGTTYSLGTLDGYATTGLRINSQNNIAGAANNGWSCYWLYSGGTLSGPYPHADGWLADISDDNIVVGGYPGSFLSPYCSGPIDLAQPISSGQFPQSISGGRVVGWATDGTSTPLRDIGIMWLPNGCASGSAIVLDYLPSGTASDASIYPMDVNSAGLVAGYIWHPTGGGAALWDHYGSGQWVYLDAVIGDANWLFSTALGISDSGHIVGQGVHNGLARCFVVRP